MVLVKTLWNDGRTRGWLGLSMTSLKWLSILVPIVFLALVRAFVSLRVEGEQLRVDVTDDGRGFDPEHPIPSNWPRFGLTLRERERAARLAARNRENTASASQPGQRPTPQTVSPRDPYHVWLDTPKNLSGRALAEAQGRVRVRNPEGTIHTWRERSEIDALLEAGWQLA